MALIPPYFLDCLVAIGSPSPVGTQWVGTGFCYMDVVESEGDQKKGRTYLVTNRHVLEGRTTSSCGAILSARSLLKRSRSRWFTTNQHRFPRCTQTQT